MGRSFLKIGATAAAAIAAAVLTVPSAHADDGRVAVANSPNHEQQDWGYGPDRVTAEPNDCVATSWDVSEPLNQIHAGSGGGPEAALRGAIAAAGPYANEVQARCTWWPRNEPQPPPSGTSLTARFE